MPANAPSAAPQSVTARPPFDAPRAARWPRRRAGRRHWAGVLPRAPRGPHFCVSLQRAARASSAGSGALESAAATTRAKFRVSPGPFCRPNLPCIRWTLSGGGRETGEGASDVEGERASRRLHGPLEERARRASYSLCRRPSTCPRTDLLSRAAASTRTARCVYARPPVHSRERVTTHRGLSRSVRTHGGR